MIVAQRHKEIEDERRRAEERKAAEEARASWSRQRLKKQSPRQLQKPSQPRRKCLYPVEETPAEVVIPTESAFVATDEIYETIFTVRATIPQLRALKEFLETNGYDYE